MDITTKDELEVIDCSKMPLDRMDLIRRTLKCLTIEIFDYDAAVSFTGEEEELSIEPTPDTEDAIQDDEDRAIRAVAEIDCLIQRIELMQLAIRHRPNEDMSEKRMAEEEKQQEEEYLTRFQLICKEVEGKRKQLGVKIEVAEPKPEQPHPLELTCQEKLEVRRLQHAYHRLQCEISDLISSYQKLRSIPRTFRLHLCAMNKQLRLMSTRVQGFNKWTKQVHSEIRECLERYQHLMHHKISKIEAQKTAKVHIYRFFARNKFFLMKSRMPREVRDFRGEIDDLCSFITDLSVEMEQRFDKFEQSNRAKNQCSNVENDLNAPLEEMHSALSAVIKGKPNKFKKLKNSTN
ncbi:uncharacterized protein LOC117591109 [Drosophila guanche]|uniref:Uncharacterized protein n=1 Tax=Drosophila guanche TaxID=7266 RepID=A0A3B0KA23_DROGU|nr:uncharacterized protein LOC117591109 [Drosophila guanche]SPP89562.1 Hypothetical predicted protein [Drosophila guanche]